MDEPTERPAASRGFAWLLLLVVLATGLRIVQFQRTEVTSRDSIAFIRYAWRLENESWLHVIKTENHHPVYPFLVYLASGPVRAFLPDDLPLAMQLTTQLVGCLASVLLVVPMFLLGKELFDRRAGFWAALLFQCLPGSGRVLADGVTEPVFLLLSATTLLFACRAVRSGVVWFVLTGLTSGLAYLTRTEGLLLPAITAVVLLGLQMSRTWRRTWRGFSEAGLGLTAATLVVAGPFMWHIGGVSLKPSSFQMLGGKWQSHRPELEARNASEGNENRPPARLAPTRLPLAMWYYGAGITPEHRYGWAARALFLMICKGFFYVLLLPFAIGLIAFSRRPARVPGLWVMLVLGGVLLPLLYRLGQTTGYLGERHVLLFVMGGLYWAAAALGELGDWVGRYRRRGGFAFRVPCWPGRRLAYPRRFVLPGVLVLPLVLVPLVLTALPKTLAPLHAERVGFRQAGRWLAEHVQPGDLVVDPFTWAAYHAGLDFQHGGKVPLTSVCYVVLDLSPSKHEHLWYLVQPAVDLAKMGQPVQSFPVKVGKYRALVVVYRVMVVVGPDNRFGRLVVSRK